MCMSHSDGVYSPPDSSESSLSDLFGSSTLASSSIASVADGIAWAHVDDDSVEIDTASKHVDWDGMVASVCLGLDGMINCISRIFSSYTDCQPVLFKNHFCLGTRESSTAWTAARRDHSPWCSRMVCLLSTMLLWRTLPLFQRMWNSRVRRRGLIWSLPMRDLSGQANLF